MHTWGRTYAEDGTYEWTKVSTDENGSNDMVYLTALSQELRLYKKESPFNADRGIDAHGSVMSQIWPDYDINLIQQRYSSYFASLTITKDDAERKPTYSIDVMTNYGVSISTEIPV
jgi:hypothetical protein